MYPYGMFRIKPVRSYRNFADFVYKQSLFRRTDGKYPCLACLGRGWTYDANDPPDPVEGSSNRRTIPCSACKGSGEGTQKACRQAYKEAVARFQAKASEYKRLVKARKEALNLLTQEQIQAIKELGL